MSLIEVGTNETGTTVLLIPVNEQTYLVVSEDGCEQDAPLPYSTVGSEGVRSKNGK